jgi:hypothetical protein
MYDAWSVERDQLLPYLVSSLSSTVFFLLCPAVMGAGCLYSSSADAMCQQQVNDVYRDEPSKLNILPTLEYTSQDRGL